MRKNKISIIILLTLLVCVFLYKYQENKIDLSDYVEVQYILVEKQVVVKSNFKTLQFMIDLNNKKNNPDEFFSIENLYSLFTDDVNKVIDTIEVSTDKEIVELGEFVKINVKWDNDLAKEIGLDLFCSNSYDYVENISTEYTFVEEFLDDSGLSLKNENFISDGNLIEKKDLHYILEENEIKYYPILFPLSIHESILYWDDFISVIGIDKDFILLEYKEEVLQMEYSVFRTFFERNGTIAGKLIDVFHFIYFKLAFNKTNIVYIGILSGIFFILSIIVFLFYFLTIKKKLEEKIMNLFFPAISFNFVIFIIKLLEPEKLNYFIKHSISLFPKEEYIFVFMWFYIVFLFIYFCYEFITLCILYRPLRGFVCFLFILLCNIFMSFSLFGCIFILFFQLGVFILKKIKGDFKK